MELPVDHLKYAMAPGQMASGIWCNPCSEFAMEVVMGADLGFAIIAPQSESEHRVKSLSIVGAWGLALQSC